MLLCRQALSLLAGASNLCFMLTALVTWLYTKQQTWDLLSWKLFLLLLGMEAVSYYISSFCTLWFWVWNVFVGELYRRKPKSHLPSLCLQFDASKIHYDVWNLENPLTYMLYFLFLFFCEVEIAILSLEYVVKLPSNFSL